MHSRRYTIPWIMFLLVVLMAMSETADPYTGTAIA